MVPTERHVQRATPELFNIHQVYFKFVMVQIVRRPYSYAVPVSRFPLKTEIRDARDLDAGKVVKVLSDLGLAEDEELDPDAVRKGPRQYVWRSDANATITWVQPLDGRRNGLGDQLFALGAPFEGEPQSLAKVDLRYQAAYWGRNDVALIVEASRKTRRVVTWKISPPLPPLANWPKPSAPGKAGEKLVCAEAK